MCHCLELIASSTVPVPETSTKPKAQRAPRKEKDGNASKDPTKPKGKGKGKEKEMPPPFTYGNAGGPTTALSSGLVTTQATLTNMFSFGGADVIPQLRPAVFESSLPAQTGHVIPDEQGNIDADKPKLQELDGNDEDLELEKQSSADAVQETLSHSQLRPEDVSEISPSREGLQSHTSDGINKKVEDDVEMRDGHFVSEDVDMT